MYGAFRVLACCKNVYQNDIDVSGWSLKYRSDLKMDYGLDYSFVILRKFPINGVFFRVAENPNPFYYFVVNRS